MKIIYEFKIYIMKIKVEVDLSDFYQEDEDGANFSEQIKAYIAWYVKQEILKDWKDKITTEFTKYVVDEIEKSKTDFVDRTLTELAVNQKVKKRYSNSEMISVVDYIKDELERTSFTTEYVTDFIKRKTRTEKDRLSKLADSISKELKDRYDLTFASQLVAKLNENGMLKDGVANLILDK